MTQPVERGKEIRVTRWRFPEELEFLRKHLTQKGFRWHEKSRGNRTAIFRWKGDIFEEQGRTKLS